MPPDTIRALALQRIRERGGGVSRRQTRGRKGRGRGTRGRK